MILTCPNCATRYSTDAATIAAPGRNVRCAKCGQVWFQAPPEIEVEPEAEPEAEAMAQQYSRPMASAAVDTAPVGVEAHQASERTAGSRLVRIGGWLVLIALVAAAIFVILQYRQTIASLWPKTASFYAAIGTPVNVLGLDFRDLRPGQTFEAGQPLLEVTGRIVNITDHRIPVPQVRVALVDGESREVYHWTFDSGVGTLAPGTAGGLVTRLSAPPQEAKNVTVRFVEAGEQ